MSVYKYDDKTCPACQRAAMVRNAAGEWTCVEKRSGCGKTWPTGTKAIENQPHTTWRYRKQVTLPDGRKVRIAGTPAINTKKAAEEAERAHVERVLNPPKHAAELLADAKAEVARVRGETIDTVGIKPIGSPVRFRVVAVYNNGAERDLEAVSVAEKDGMRTIEFRSAGEEILAWIQRRPNQADAPGTKSNLDTDFPPQGSLTQYRGQFLFVFCRDDRWHYEAVSIVDGRRVEERSDSVRPTGFSTSSESKADGRASIDRTLKRGSAAPAEFMEAPF